MDEPPYWIIEGMWYIFVLIMTPKVLYDATVQDGFAGLLIGLFVTMILLLMPQILKGK